MSVIPTQAPRAAVAPPSLYVRLGGADAIAAVVDAFYARVLADELLSPLFAGKDMAQQRTHQTRFMSYALGGPNQYKGRSMQRAHAGLGITPTQFAAVAGHLAATLRAFAVPEAWIDEVIGHVAGLRNDIVGQ